MYAKEFTDQMNRPVNIPFPPQRIISLVPSQTELLYYLGLKNSIAGITKFCIHPAGEVILAPKIGGTKKLNVEKIKSLQPDLIIGNKEENDRDQIETFSRDFPVWMSDIHVLDDALKMIGKIGCITDTSEQALKLCREIGTGFLSVKTAPVSKKILYLIWKKPWMAAGKNTFIDDMLVRCGWKNALDQERYPVLSDEDISALSPDVILLSSEPYPFQEKHITELKGRVPSARIILVDGEMFSWYGSRLLHIPQYFNSLIKELR